MEIQVIIENTSSNSKLKGKHGLSLLITTNSNRILYDFGPNNCLYRNAKKLNIDLEKIDLAILSHNHIDHAGDLDNFLKINKSAIIHTNSSLSDKLYTELFFGIKIPIGAKFDNKYLDRLKIHNISESIASNIHFVQLSKYSCNSTLNKKLYIKVNGKLQNDTFKHESALVIIENNELIVFCSCSHHGVNQIITDIEINFGHLEKPAFRTQLCSHL